MRMGLQVGFGQPIGRETLEKIKAAGFRLVRIDGQDGRDPALAREVIDAGLEPLVIIRNADQIASLPRDIDLEFGNEPDIEKFGWTKYSNVERALSEAANSTFIRYPP